ncbi:MAG: hypothetical protein IJR47_00480 [Clostridia bacterium]|nr:hypothetical protein [Clostridia bacterium]
MNSPIEAIKKGRLYNGYIICAGHIASALACAKEMANALLTVPTIIEEPKMETIRALQKSLYEDVQIGEAKVAIICADGISPLCQNALLKTIEEQKSTATIIFTVTNMAHLLPTIISRCVTYYPPAISEDKLLDYTNNDLVFARYALGSRERAEELCADGSVKEQRIFAKELMLKLKKGETHLFSKEDSKNIPEYCRLILMFLRDALTKDIFWFFDMKEAVLTYIDDFTIKQIMVMIKAAENAEIKLYTKTNPMLVMDKLQLEIWEVIHGNNHRS